MRNYRNTALATIVFFVVSIACIAQKHGLRPHVRIDGFYLYDNGLDTTVLIPGGREMQMQLIKFASEHGYKFSHDSTNNHPISLDSEAKSSIGSTDIRFLAFYNDTAGMVWGAIYRDKNVLNNFKVTYDLRKNKEIFIDSNLILSDFRFVNDSTLTFTKASRYSDHYFEEYYRCTLRDDNLIVKTNRYVNPLDNKERTYIFIPFNDIPADLITKYQKTTQ